uniref:Kringle domain-containing protein n=1 Tax=Mesocestoides corti TaxID=53468 RepID=A0A5K3EY25_MESCO
MSHCHFNHDNIQISPWVNAERSRSYAGLENISNSLASWGTNNCTTHAYSNRRVPFNCFS